jgi:hypothetical protein
VALTPTSSLCLSQSQFAFALQNGLQLKEEDTPISLNLEDHDVIFAAAKNRGGDSGHEDADLSV